MEASEREQFGAWQARRGVWPRLTHEEIFEAGLQAARAEAGKSEFIYSTEDIDEVTHRLTGDEGEDDSITVLRSMARYVENVWPGKTALQILIASEEAKTVAPNELVEGCHRSHPHEEMSAECAAKVEPAKLACLKRAEQPAQAQPESVDAKMLEIMTNMNEPQSDPLDGTFIERWNVHLLEAAIQRADSAKQSAPVVDMPPKWNQRVQCLFEAARCLGVAQQANDEDAAKHWSAKAEALVMALKSSASIAEKVCTHQWRLYPMSGDPSQGICITCRDTGPTTKGAL